MTYIRVIPRDLFNEGNLLTCLGRLWIQLDERRDHSARLDFFGGDFEIDQDPADGSIRCRRIELDVFASPADRDENMDARPVGLFRPLNSRDKWPLWARFGDGEGDYEDLLVFDGVGNLSDDFWERIKA